MSSERRVLMGGCEEVAAATALVYLGLVTSVVAQTASSEGSIRGFVKDEQGAVLPGVVVTATGQRLRRRRHRRRGSRRVLRLIGLQPGTLRWVPNAGFFAFERPGVVDPLGTQSRSRDASSASVICPKPWK